MLRSLCALLLLRGAKAAASACKDLPRIAYVIYAHDAETVQSSFLLLDAIYDPENLYFVHVDRKFTGFKDASVVSLVRGRPNIECAQIHDVGWAKWSMLEPTLWAMERARQREEGWEIFINLSGDSWPVLTPPALRRALAPIRGLNIVASAPMCPTGLRPTARSEFGDGWHKKQAYPALPIPQLPTLEAYFGSQWMIISREFCEFVLDELETPGTPANLLRQWFLTGSVLIEGVGRVRPHIPDETFFPTVLMNSRFAEANVPQPIEVLSDGAPLLSAFYIRMDEHYPWSSTRQRYLASDLDNPGRPWGPYYLGAYDLADIRAHRSFFVRKVSRRVDPSIFELLPVDNHTAIPRVAWPTEIQICVSNTPSIPTLSRKLQGQPTETGCVRVGESVHCAPTHHLSDDVRQSEERYAAALAALPPGYF